LQSEQSSVSSSSNSSSSDNNANKLKRINELHANIEAFYHTAIDNATGGIEKNGIVKYSIQQVALTYEEIYKLHGQDWMIDQIGSIIVKDLKTRGFPDTKYRYVYEAIKVYDDRFISPIEHSTSQTVSGLTKQQELFYRTNAKPYYDALSKIKEMRNDYDNLLARDIQTLVPSFLDEYDYHEKQCKQKAILLPKSKQDDFEGGPDPFEEKLQIHKPVPIPPESLTVEINIWIKSFLPALLKKLTEYPVEKERDKRMAAGWCAIRHMHDPFTDDKYREDWPHWIEIIEFSDQAFKSQTASQFKTKDFRGQFRKLTREQIGSRKVTVPQWCQWFFDNTPGFFEAVAWFREEKKPYVTGFSIDLSPKLSHQSMR
jgi:hypothetical protein